jgi:uncharacterized protein (DUF4415 family)
MEGIERNDTFALAKPLSDQLKARARRSSTNYLIPFLEEEFSANSTTHRVEPGSTLDWGMRHPLTLSIDADLVDLIKSKAVSEKRDLTDITEELYRQYLT